MDRAFEDILRTSRAAGSNLDSQTERPITITPRDYIHDNPTPIRVGRSASFKSQESSSEESYSVDEMCECTQKRKISELLIKIEKLKRRLLDEYGSNLPDSIFSASMKSLFFDKTLTPSNEEKVQNTEPVNLHEQSQIQVINMSQEESNRPPKKIFKSKPPPVIGNKKTSKSSTRDQQVQVELESENSAGRKACQDSHSIHKMQKAHSAESVLKILPSSNDSSSTYSDSSTSTDVLINIDNKEITVVPKERDNNIKLSNEIASTVHANRLKSQTTKNPVRISFNKNSCAFEVGGLLIDPGKKEITVLPQKQKTPEVENQSSQKTLDNVQNKQNTTKQPTKDKKKLIANKTITKKTTSQKSNSYKSSSSQSRSLPNSRANSPVKKQAKSEPSSRTMSPKKVCKNVVDKQSNYEAQYTHLSIDSSTTDSSIQYIDSGKHLYCRIETMAAQKFASKISKTNRMQDTSDTSTTYASPPSCTPGTFLNNSNNTSILELLDANGSLKPRESPQTLKLLRMMSSEVIASRENGRTIKEQSERAKNYLCTCKNRNCKLAHEKSDDAQQEYALKHCPEMLKKYEDLQNVCTERINSLTNLIHKVRTEQKGKVYLKIVAASYHL